MILTKSKSAFLLILIFFLYQSNSNSQSNIRYTGDFVNGRNYSIYSNILKEGRKISVFLPQDYNDTASYKYPVVYVLDHHFTMASGVVSFLIESGKIPPVILIGIKNIDRMRDMAPTHSLIGYDGLKDEKFNTTGGSDNFIKFLSDELIPAINNNYYCRPTKI